MATNNFTELDFTKLKDSLKQFLKNQDQFKDYDFDGAGLNVLVELLAYNTQYNAFYSNMIANEMFLDSAVLRESIASRAKAIGYVPHSAKAAKGIVKVDFTPALGPGPANPSSILIPQWTKFTAPIKNKVYTFQNQFALSVPNSGGGHYIAELVVSEGTLLEHEYIVDNTLEIAQRFILPNTNIDTSTLSVKVQTSAAVPSILSYFLATDVNVLTKDSVAYFLQEVEGGKYEIYFGDGVVGKRLENGNIITVEYLVCSAEDGNGAKTFMPVSTIANYTGTVYTKIQNSQGGVSKENDASIKFLAPAFYESQNRAVNKHDYETLVKKDYPQVEFVRVWGGEENDPPVYGKVYMSLKPYGALAFSEQEKLSIINSIIRPRSPVSIETLIVEPDYLQLIVESSVKVKSKSTTLSLGSIQTIIEEAIQDYRDANLLGFDSAFRYSKLVNAIDASDPSVQNNLTNIKLKYTITPPINLPARFEINLNAKIDKGDANNNISALNSTGFTKDGLTSYIGDDGMGNLYIYRIVLSTKVIVEKNFGTIDYDTGKIIIPSLIIQGIPGGDENIDLILLPGQNDLNPIRNQIITILDEDIKVTIVDEDA